MSIVNGSIVYFYNDANVLHIAKVAKVIGEEVELEDCHLKVGETFKTLREYLKPYKVKMPKVLTECIHNVKLIDHQYLDDAMSIYFPAKEVYNSNRNW